MSNLSSGLLTWSSFVSELCVGRSFIQKAMNNRKIKEIILVLLFIAACGFAGADSGDFKGFVLTKIVALFLFGLACVEGKGLWKQKETTTLKKVFIKPNLKMSDFDIIPENESLSETWAMTRRKEIEADLSGAEKIATVREVSKTILQAENRVLMLDVIESARPRKKRVTRLQVSERDLGNTVRDQGKPIQLALF
jgi:hypothetical protein